MILDSPIITGSLLQQAGQFAEIPRYTDVSSSLLVVSASLNAKINALNTDTGSQASRLSNLETTSASVNSSISNINSVTASFSPRVSNLESKSASVDISISSINTFTSSNSNTSLNSYTASNDTTNTTQTGRLNNLESKSSSVDISITSINSFTASNNVTSLNSATSSYETKGRGIVSGSAQVTPLLPTGVVSGSSQLDGTTITNLTITNLTTVNETATTVFSSGSNRFGDFGDDIHSFTGSVKISGSIVTLGTSTATSFSGQINATNGVVSGSSQVVSILNSLNTYTASVSTASLATLGSNTFVGNQIVSGTLFITGSIVPGVDNIYDLGSSTKSFRHLYVSSGSIYMNGTRVISSNAQELQFTTDAGQSIKILEAGSDTITLQSADGNITFASSGGGDVILDPNTGVIALKGTTTLYSGYKIVSSDGNAIQFGNDLGITGSIYTTGNVNGVNLSTFSSSVSSQLTNINSVTSSYETKGKGIWSGSAQLPLGVVSSSAQTILNLPTGTVSGSSQILGGTGIFSSSAQLPIGVISGSSQLTSSYDTRYVVSGSITQTTWDNIASKPSGIVSGSSQLTSSYDTRYVVSGSITQTTWDNIASKPDGIVSGSSQLSGTTIQNLSGSFTGSFKGDGSLLSGLTAGGKIFTQSTPASTWTFAHNLNVQYPNVTVYDSNGNVILPQSIIATDVNTLVLNFGANVSGTAVAGIGGIINVQGRTTRQYFTSSLSWNFTHNLGDQYVNIQTIDDTYNVMIPQNIVLTDSTSSVITFPELTSGWALATIGGNLPSIDSSQAGYTLQVSSTSPYSASWVAITSVTSSNAQTASYVQYSNVANKPTLVSGSTQIDITGTTNYTTFSSSIATSISSSNASISLVSSSNATIDLTQNNRLSSIENVTSSYAISSSVALVDLGQNNRLSSIENVTASLNAATSSYAKLSGGNTFTGTQIISGSTFIAGDLIVQGSSSIQYISASSVNIGTNTIELNVATPSVRFAGITIQDSGSLNGVTGSLMWDSQNNGWIYGRESGSTYRGGAIISGPRNTTGIMGCEQTTNANALMKGQGGDHISSSLIYTDESITCFYNNALYVSSSCKVGMATSNPEFTLDVNGDIALSRTQRLQFTGPTVGDRNRAFIGGTPNNDLYFAVAGGTCTLKLAYTGETCFSGVVCSNGVRTTDSVVLLKNAATDNRYLQFCDTNTSGYRYDFILQSTTQGCGFGLYNNNTACWGWYLAPNGNFGINTTSLSYPLTRNGMTIKASGNDGVEFVMLSCVDTGFLGGALVRNGCDFGFINRTSGNIIFATNAVERMYITNAGNVGIGINDPKSTLDVATTTSGTDVSSTLTLSALTNAAYGQCSMIQAFVNDSGNGECANIGLIQFIKQRPAGNCIGGDMVFSTRTPASSGMSSPTERMRITSTGQLIISACCVGIGTTTPYAPLQVNGNIHRAWITPGSSGTPYMEEGFVYSEQSNSNALAGMWFENVFSSSNGVAVVFKARNNAATVAERMRINSDGYVSIGANTSIAPLAVYVCGPTTLSPTVQFVSYCGSGSQVYTTIGGSDSWHGIALRGVPACMADWSITAGNQMSFFEYGSDFRFYQKQPSSMALHVQFLNGTIYAVSTSISAISDIRLKENIRDISYGLNEIIQLKPKMYDWKEGHGNCIKDNLGFIAQDVETILPELVSDWNHTEGEISYKTLKMGDMIPVLTKAIQEQQCTICSQATMINILKSCIGIA